MEASTLKGPGLYEFLVEAELQHYYNSIKSELKILNPSQLKYATDEDLVQLGMSNPEKRRLKKFYSRHFSTNYLDKLKRLLFVPRNDGLPQDGISICSSYSASGSGDSLERPPGPRVPSKHIISSESITINKELGVGEFGVVQQGVWCNDGERIQVAIKQLARERMQTNTIEFLKEAVIMHSINHAHIVRMYGVVLETDSLMLVTELAPLRSLLECLREPALRSSFPVLTLCDFALQICDGMQYLEMKRLIHRDLAARNILVFSKNKVKISDFGLSRALGQGKDYYQTNFNVNLKLPIAWCAPESITYLKFTSASDVWAYGVTLWEMFSYGFGPWTALTGQQILEAIDAPNFQRLEKPDSCPEDHYKVMLECWAHDPARRPHFSDLLSRLADIRPEQVQAKVNIEQTGSHMLPLRIGEVITVLDKNSDDRLWKGVLPNGKTGKFNPINVVTYLGNNLPTVRNKNDAFTRNELRTSSRRKLHTEMISSPQGDVKHTGHVGPDGVYFGDLSFLGGNKFSYNQIPRQVVNPYKPHEDLDQAPLLSAIGQAPLHSSDHINLPVLPPICQPDGRQKLLWDSGATSSDVHEYHEISDEENLVAQALDLGPSLMDEMELVMRSYNSSLPPSPADHEGANKCNELRELSSKLTGGKHKKQSIVKPISAMDEKALDTAIAMANEISAKSLNDLDLDPPPNPAMSPTKRKFSFRFSTANDHDVKAERRNFSEEAQSIPDLQSTLTEEAQKAYEGLIESPLEDIGDQPQLLQLGQPRSYSHSLSENPLRMLRLGQLPVIRPRLRSNPSDGIGQCSKARDEHGGSVSYIDSIAHAQGAAGTSTLSKTVMSKSHDSMEDSNQRPMSEDAGQSMENVSEDNPIPLPPKPKQASLASKPRHTRKHPLIIPASSIQRTLDKVAVTTPEDKTPFLDNNICVVADAGERQRLRSPEPFYTNQSFLRHRRDLDSDSLHFEAQIDSSLAALDDLTLDEGQAEAFDGEPKPPPTTCHQEAAMAQQQQPQPSAGVDVVDGAAGLRHCDDHVSCEDLLEFADSKPSSRTRGNDSDEVRIMQKVLGPEVSSDQCLLALEHSSWDVHKAIKLVKLHLVVKGASSGLCVDFSTCSDALEHAQWDVGRAASWIIAAHAEGDITQV